MKLRCCLCNKSTEAYGECAEGRWVPEGVIGDRMFLCDQCYSKVMRARKNNK